MMGATIRLDERDYAALKGEARPTQRAPGYWRCMFWIGEPEHWNIIDPTPLGDGQFLCGPRFVSEEIADEEGRRSERYWRPEADELGGRRYVRAEYFPDYPGGAS